MKKIAAFDIGSNAIRMVIAHIEKDGVLTIRDKIRVPLRLGTEAFSQGYFSEHTMGEALRVFKKFKREIELQEVEYYRAVATSAYRNSGNAQDLGSRILSETGIFIEAIDGSTEASFIRMAIQTKIDLREKDYLLLDIGGGSTEITYLINGQEECSKSFPVGTVRLLEIGKNAEKEGLDCRKGYSLYLDELTPHISDFFSKKCFSGKPLYVIGTGGNFKRLSKLRKKILGKKNNNMIYPEDVSIMRKELESVSQLNRVKKFKLRQDRADVIIPASYIIEKVMNHYPVKKIMTPDVGLIHGLLFNVAGEGLFKFKDEVILKQ